jgi:hypothetical protein
MPNERLADVLYFTAYTDWNTERQSRHHAYIAVNQNRGCKVILGKFQEITRTSRVKCHRPCIKDNTKLFCDKPYPAHEEKMTDVNIAVNIIKSCVQKSCDAVYLLSGDNDLVPALETARELCPDIRIRVLLPINAKAKKLMTACREHNFKYMRVKERHLAESQLPNSVTVGDKVYSKPPHWS